MITTQKGSRVGKTGSTCEVDKRQIDKGIEQELKDIRDDFRGGHIISCPKCSERFKIMDSKEAKEVYDLFNIEGCPMCKELDPKKFKNDLVFDILIGQLKVYVLKLRCI